MKALIEKSLELGATSWKKDSMERVYINGDEMFGKVFDLEKKDSPYAGTFKTIGRAKVWFNVKNESLHSDVGMVRVLLNNNGFNCGK